MAVIGIDLGGTKIIGALFDENGTILHQSSSLLGVREGKEVGQLVLNTIDELIESADSIEDTIQGIGICVPGIADSKTGLVWAPNIQGWDNYPLLEEVKTHVSNQNKEVKRHVSDRNISVDIASDRTCYILGEKWKGAAKNSKNALFISVGTGIGVGLLIDGNIVHGHGDIVGAAGWFGLGIPHTQEFDKYGCFESIASGDGIARQAKKLLEKGQSFKKSNVSKREDLEENDLTKKHMLEEDNINLGQDLERSNLIEEHTLDRSSLSEEQDYENSLLGEIELDRLTSRDVFAAFDKIIRGEINPSHPARSIAMGTTYRHEADHF